MSCLAWATLPTPGCALPGMQHEPQVATWDPQVATWDALCQLPPGMLQCSSFVSNQLGLCAVAQALCCLGWKCGATAWQRAAGVCTRWCSAADAPEPVQVSSCLLGDSTKLRQSPCTACGGSMMGTHSSGPTCHHRENGSPQRSLGWLPGIHISSLLSLNSKRGKERDLHATCTGPSASRAALGCPASNQGVAA